MAPLLKDVLAGLAERLKARSTRESLVSIKLRLPSGPGQPWEIVDAPAEPVVAPPLPLGDVLSGKIAFKPVTAPAPAGSSRGSGMGDILKALAQEVLKGIVSDPDNTNRIATFIADQVLAEVDRLLAANPSPVMAAVKKVLGVPEVRAQLEAIVAEELKRLLPGLVAQIG